MFFYKFKLLNSKTIKIDINKYIINIDIFNKSIK